MVISQFPLPSYRHSPPSRHVPDNPVTLCKVIQANMAWVSSCSNVEKYAPEKSRRKMKNHESKYAAEPSKKVWWLSMTVRSMSLRQSSSTANGKSSGEMRARGHFKVPRKKLGNSDGCNVDFSVVQKLKLKKKCPNIIWLYLCSRPQMPLCPVATPWEMAAVGLG